MNVRDNIAAGKYLPKTVWPVSPSRPDSLNKGHTSMDARRYADDLREYEVALADVKRRQQACKIEQGVCDDQFKADLFEEFGMADHYKKDQVFTFAWEEGHSEGHTSVYEWFSRIADLIK